MSTTIVIGNLKGGTGKTNTAMHLAIGATAAGLRVHVIDGDARSQSAYDWAKLANKSGEPLPFEVERFPHEDIDEHIEKLRDQYDLVLVDSGGSDHDYLEAAVRAADGVLVTMAPERPEGRRIASTLKTATRGAEQNTRPDGVAMLVLLTRVVLASTQRTAWRQQLEHEGYEVADTEIRRLVGYSDAYGTHPKSVGDYADLLAELEIVQPQAQGTTA